MIAAWQKKNGRAATGYVSAETQAALLRDAQPALARYDEEQKKLADTQNQAAAAGARAGLAAKGGSGQCDGSYSSQWCRGAFQGFPPSCWNVPMTITNGAISGSWTSPGATEAQTFSGRIDAGGEVQHHLQRHRTTDVHRPALHGADDRKMAGGVITAGGRPGSNGRDFTVTVAVPIGRRRGDMRTRIGRHCRAGRHSVVAAPACDAATFDGNWNGTQDCETAHGGARGFKWTYDATVKQAGLSVSTGQRISLRP